MDTLARIEHRPFRRRQHIRHPLHIRRVRTIAQPLHRCVLEIRNLRRGDIGRDLHQRRARPPAPHRRERPPHRIRRHLRRRQLLARFGDRRIALGGVEVGLHLVDRPRISAGQDDDRGGIPECLCHAAECVL